ncbi:MAG: bifunctional metallophosphatase/5'-nucleotidase [Chloroflexi bacterium]|nr:bifunctional metallophosphatase/5'-nucleotidase [Chloroflexota bacterium]
MKLSGVKKHLLLIVLLAAFILQAGAGLAFAADTVKIVVITTNDMHGQLTPKTNKRMIEPPQTVGGVAYVATVIGDIKRDYPNHCLTLDMGDFAQGTIESNSFVGLPMIEFMDFAGYDAMAVGNHEFDWGIDKMGKTLKKAKFPVLCANVTDTKTGKPLPFCKPYEVKEIDGVKIGLIGVLTPVAKTIVKAENIAGYDIEDPAKAINRIVPILKTRGCKMIIVMSHNGLDEDKEIAENIHDVQLITGGHSHTFLEKPEKVNGVLITQAGSSGCYVGKLVLDVDKDTGSIVNYNEDYLVPVIDKDITPNPKMEKMVAEYKEKVRPILEQPVGELGQDLDNERAYQGLDSSIGDFITDGIRHQTEADIAFYNAGGIRSTFKKGKLNFGDVFAVLPFDDAVVSMDLTGAQVKEIVVRGFSKKGVIQFSGMEVTYDPGKEDADRIVDIKVSGAPLDLNKVYRVSTTAFLAGGGDNFTTFKEGKNVQYGDFARDVMALYIKNASPIKEVEVGRTKKLGTNEVEKAGESK